MASYMIKKILNNNVVVAKAPSQPEVIMIGKGIGFAKQKGQKISEEETEKSLHAH
ncbi:MAG: CAT RNA binding domain-containing protein [Bacillaceae bacterium]|nr:CAT RNA binding domain-containing protein [Bacillaceae bacterium]